MTVICGILLFINVQVRASFVVYMYCSSLSGNFMVIELSCYPNFD